MSNEPHGLTFVQQNPLFMVERRVRACVRCASVCASRARTRRHELEMIHRPSPTMQHDLFLMLSVLFVRTTMHDDKKKMKIATQAMCTRPRRTALRCNVKCPSALCVCVCSLCLHFISRITLHLAATVIIISETNMRMLFLMRSTLVEIYRWTTEEETLSIGQDALSFISQFFLHQNNANNYRNGEKSVGNFVSFIPPIVCVVIVAALP